MKFFRDLLYFSDEDLARRYRLPQFYKTELTSLLEFVWQQCFKCDVFNLELLHYEIYIRKLSISILSVCLQWSCPAVELSIEWVLYSLIVFVMKSNFLHRWNRTHARDLFNIANFLNVFGCIDGSHVRIKRSESEFHFFNRKWHHSINIECECNYYREIYTFISIT